MPPSHLLASLKLGLNHLRSSDTDKVNGPTFKVTTIQLSAFRKVAMATPIGISKPRVGNKAMVIKILAIQSKSLLMKYPRLSWRLENMALIINWGAWSSLIWTIKVWVGSSATTTTKTSGLSFNSKKERGSLDLRDQAILIVFWSTSSSLLLVSPEGV